MSDKYLTHDLRSMANECEYHSSALAKDCMELLRNAAKEIERLRITSNQRGKLIENMEAEIERLQNERDEAYKQINNWFGATSCIGTHQSCGCPACTKFKKWIMDKKEPTNE